MMENRFFVNLCDFVSWWRKSECHEDTKTRSYTKYFTPHVWQFFDKGNRNKQWVQLPMSR